MQKQILYKFLLAIIIFLFSDTVNASIISLPRYTGEFAYRTGVGGRNKINLTCNPDGVEKGNNQICSGPFSRGGKHCYKECHCSDGFKIGLNAECIAKKCEDYSLNSTKEINKNCTQVSRKPDLNCFECVECDINIYKYKCSGGLNALEQEADNKCSNDYSKCNCIENAFWKTESGKCVCNKDYMEIEGQCLLMQCKDYNSEYLAKEDMSKNCLKVNPRSNLECWSCEDCDATYKYTCSVNSSNHIKNGKGDTCGGKYKECECDNILYNWSKGACTLNCTRYSCSETLYPLLERNIPNVSSYEECVPNCSDESKRFKIASCNLGFELENGACICHNRCNLTSCPVGAICEKEDCSGKLCAVGCKESFITPINYLYLFYLF